MITVGQSLVRSAAGDLAEWSPNQLRHTAGSEVRAEFRAEHAQAILGHSNLSTTEIYAEVPVRIELGHAGPGSRRSVSLLERLYSVFGDCRETNRPNQLPPLFQDVRWNQPDKMVLAGLPNRRLLFASPRTKGSCQTKALWSLRNSVYSTPKGHGLLQPRLQTSEVSRACYRSLFR